MNRVFTTLALVGGLLTGGVALASATPVAGEMRVDDQAGAFTPAGVTAATNAFHGTAFRSPTHLTVVTAGHVPESRRAEFETAASSPERRAQFFDTWARELAATNTPAGVFVFVYLESTGDGKERYIVRTLASKHTDVHRGFHDADTRQVNTLLTAGLDQAKGKPAAEAKPIRDAALLEATNYVAAQLKNTTLPVAAAKHAVAGERAGAGWGLSGWLCLGLSVLLGVWVVIGLIRAMSGGGGPGGPGGFGGGGFFSSLMGGMFGAMAGMWMYNNLFGGGMSDIGATDGAADATTGDTGADSYDGGASGGSEGGDWGGGADAGGGDWGGGGDFGGGDW